MAGGAVRGFFAAGVARARSADHEPQSRAHRADVAEENMKRLFAGMLAGAMLVPAGAAPADGDWPNYGRTPGGDRHSPLTQIDRGNVASLKLAWEYRTGEA